MRTCHSSVNECSLLIRCELAVAAFIVGAMLISRHAAQLQVCAFRSSNCTLRPLGNSTYRWTSAPRLSRTYFVPTGKRAGKREVLCIKPSSALKPPLATSLSAFSSSRPRLIPAFHFGRDRVKNLRSTLWSGALVAPPARRPRRASDQTLVC